MIQTKQLWLLRHGEPVGGDGRIRGQSNDPLTDRGWQQLVSVVSDLQVDEVHSSPLLRCVRFAQDYAQQQSIACHVDDRLIEMGMGCWEGKAKQEVMAGQVDLWRYAQSPESQLPVDAEPFMAVQQRVASWLADMQQRPAGRLLVVAHAGVLRFMLAQLLQMPVESVLRIKLPFAACLPIKVQWDTSMMLGQLHWPDMVNKRV